MGRHEHISLPFLQELYLLAVQCYKLFKLAMPMYKRLHDSALPYLSDLPFGVRCRTSSPRIDCTDVCCAVHQDPAGDRSFDVMSPQIWNKLPASMHMMEDLGYFRRLLKARIFDPCCGT